MDAKNVKILAVVAVVVVIVAGVAVYFAMNNNDRTPKYDPADVKLELLSSDLKPVLEVYGNVNNDLVIDQKDVDLLEKALKDGTASSYKYADANFDGTVDNADVEYIKKIMNATFDNPVEIKHLQRYSDGDYYLAEGRSTTIPTNSLAITAAANMLTMFKHLGICDQIKCVAYYSTVDPVILSEYQKFFVDSDKKFDVTGDYVYRVGSSAGYFSEELLTNHIVNDGITVLITADNKSSYLNGPSKSYPYGITEDRAYELGLDVVRVAHASADNNSYLSDLALLALITGTDTASIVELQDWLSDSISKINKKLEDEVGKGYVEQLGIAVSSSATYSVDKDGKVSTSNYVSSRASDYTTAVLGAGGKFVMDSYPWKEGSSSSSKMEDLGKWLIDYDIDKLLVFKTGSGFSWYKAEASTAAVVKGCALAFQDSEPYYNNNVYVLSGDMPIFIRAVYSAHVLYPELFSESWADKLNVEYCTKFLKMSESDITGAQMFVTMEDLGLSGH